MNRESISANTYVGRFAPSPSGPLHFGSLVAAVGSYLDARAVGGRWLVRMEDLDTPRNVPGADADILATLARYGLHWDGEVLYQSQRIPLYQDALEKLRQQGRCFPCACTRREISDSQTRTVVPGGETRYPGTCRAGLAIGRTPRSWRFLVSPGECAFADRVQGRQTQDVEARIGDFVLRRADGIVAYQLAVVVDDAAQEVTRIVRGADLLDSTARQIQLQQALGYPEPDYGHLPVAANEAGEKLSKQTKARSLAGYTPEAMLPKVLDFLGQPLPPPGLPHEEILAWAVAHWDIARVPRCRARRVPHELAGGEPS